MPRIPYPDMEAISQEKRAAVGWPKRMPINITRIALHMDDGIWRGHFGLKNAVVNDATIDPWLREIIIMRVAWLANSEYELHHHISMSAHMGFTPEQQEALRTQDYSSLTEEERTVAQFTDELITSYNPSDEIMAKMRALFSDAHVLEMTTVAASYLGTAMMAFVAGLENDEVALKNFVPLANPD